MKTLKKFKQTEDIKKPNKINKLSVKLEAIVHLLDEAQEMLKEEEEKNDERAGQHIEVSPARS